MNNVQHKVLIAQGGGPTAVINESLVGAVLAARAHTQIASVWGARHGVRGIIEEHFIDLSRETNAHLERVAKTPSAALGSTRDKPDSNYCSKILQVLKKNNIDIFLYIGGNDSSDTLRILNEQAALEQHPLTCIHIPKTIDNDLVKNDHTPGYPSAARFVANAFRGVDLDNRSIPGVYIGIVMGRHAGFLTAAAAMARQGKDDGPHLIYLPERDFDLKRFTDDVQSVFDRLGRCVVAVSEGIHDSSGTPILTSLMAAKDVEHDAHGNVQLSGTGALADLLTAHLKENTNLPRMRGDTLGYLQRSYLGCVSETDSREAREVGELAINFATLETGAGRPKSGSITMQRCGDYRINYALVPLEEIAAKTKTMDDKFISEAGNDVTPAFINYLRPLLGAPLADAVLLRGKKVVSC